MKKIIIKFGDGTKVPALLNETETARAIYDALPFTSEVETWGEEIYFEIPLKLKEEKPKAYVQLGDLGYWLPGKAMCIFFGKTPTTKGDKIEPYSPVNVFGRLEKEGDMKILKEIKAEAKVTVERA